MGTYGKNLENMGNKCEQLEKMWKKIDRTLTNMEKCGETLRIWVVYRPMAVTVGTSVGLGNNGKT